MANRFPPRRDETDTVRGTHHSSVRVFLIAGSRAPSLFPHSLKQPELRSSDDTIGRRGREDAFFRLPFGQPRGFSVLSMPKSTVWAKARTPLCRLRDHATGFIPKAPGDAVLILKRGEKKEKKMPAAPSLLEPRNSRATGGEQLCATEAFSKISVFNLFFPYLSLQK